MIDYMFSNNKKRNIKQRKKMNKTMKTRREN